MALKGGAWAEQRTATPMAEDSCVGMACMEPADNLRICAVLKCLWCSDKFSLLCTGGDFSLPGAAMQEMHADLGSRHKVGNHFSSPVLTMNVPATVKVYLPLVSMDDTTGPPVFVPGSHLQYLSEDVPEADPPSSKHAYCPGGSALIMDMRVWHHGTPNRSCMARPMLAMHYAAPWYCENVLTSWSGYWSYHRGCLTREALLSMRPSARRLCCNLVYQRCEQCGCPSGQDSPSTGWHSGAWFCEGCWADWRRDRKRDLT